MQQNEVDSDEEVEEFLAAEKEKEKEKKKWIKAFNKDKNKEKKKQNEDKRLFMQLGFFEQRKEGTNAPVLRQVEGDSLYQRVRTYRKTISFHIHGKIIFCKFCLGSRVSYIINQKKKKKKKNMKYKIM